MERAQLLKLIKRRACSLIRSNSIMSAVKYRELDSLSDEEAVRVGTIKIMHEVAKTV